MAWQDHPGMANSENTAYPGAPGWTGAGQSADRDTEEQIRRHAAIDRLQKVLDRPKRG